MDLHPGAGDLKQLQEDGLISCPSVTCVISEMQGLNKVNPLQRDQGGRIVGNITPFNVMVPRTIQFFLLIENSQYFSATTLTSHEIL